MFITRNWLPYLLIAFFVAISFLFPAHINKIECQLYTISITQNLKLRILEYVVSGSFNVNIAVSHYEHNGKNVQRNTNKAI